MLIFVFMNGIQKRIIIFTVLIIILSFVLWFMDGMKTFTMLNYIPVPEDMHQPANPAAEGKFVWGLDLTLLISGMILLLAGFIYKKQGKQKENKN